MSDALSDLANGRYYRGEKGNKERQERQTAEPDEQYILKVLGDCREEIVERLSSPFSQETIKEMQEITRKHDAAIIQKERERIIKLLEDMHERKYDPSPNNRTDDGGMYNEDELDLISEIQELIKKGDVP